MLPDGTNAKIDKNSYDIPPIFGLIQKTGSIEENMMYSTYNMGLGMVLALDPADADKAVELLKAAGEKAYIVGSVIAGEKGVTLC